MKIRTMALVSTILATFMAVPALAEAPDDGAATTSPQDIVVTASRQEDISRQT